MPRLVFLNPANLKQQYVTTSMSDPGIPAGYILTSGSDGAPDCPLQTFMPGLNSGGFPTYAGEADIASLANPNGLLNWFQGVKVTAVPVISKAQHIFGDSGVGVSSINPSPSQNTVAGNLLVIEVGLLSSTVRVSSVTDPAGNTWQVADHFSGPTTSVEIWYTLQDKGTLSSGVNITVHFSGSVTAAASGNEFSASMGWPPASSIVSNTGEGQAGTSTTPASTSAAVVANALAIGAVAFNSQTSYAQNTGWTNDGQPNATGLTCGADYITGTKAGSLTHGATIGSSSAFADMFVIFSPLGLTG